MIDLTFRQTLALYRVVQSMNMIHAHISTVTGASGDLDDEEMHDLQHRLDAALHRHAEGKEL